MEESVNPADANFWVWLPFSVRSRLVACKEVRTWLLRISPRTVAWRFTLAVCLYVCKSVYILMYVCKKSQRRSLRCICTQFMHTVNHSDTRTTTVESFKFSYLSRSSRLGNATNGHAKDSRLRCARSNPGCIVEVYLTRLGPTVISARGPLQLPLRD